MFAFGSLQYSGIEQELFVVSEWQSKNGGEREIQLVPKEKVRTKFLGIEDGVQVECA